MPYVKRNQHGKVVQLTDEPSDGASEWLELNDPDVVGFLRHQANKNELKNFLTISDNEMVRVIEDLIDILMEKQVFVFTELPDAVQAKLNSRKKIRHDVNALSNLISDDDNIL